MEYLTGYETIKYGKDFWNCLQNSKKLIVYGAGNICRQCLTLFNNETKRKIIGIAVTNVVENEKFVDEIEVRNIDTFLNDTDSTIIIAIGNINTVLEIKKELESKKFLKILIFNCDALKFYEDLSSIKRSKLLSKAKMPCALLSQENIFGKALNIGKFIEGIQEQALEFSTISLVWGGSSLLDYALLRGLVLKYKIDTYLEIGTYIGDSLTVVSDLVARCYSISVPEDHPAHMKNWCHMRHMNDYSNKLITGDNIIQYQEDSKKFDYEKIKENIGLYFIDGDHSYQGILIDSLKVLEHFDPDNNFIVWHDCRNGAGRINLEVIRAIQEAMGTEYFKNFFIFDNCMCGIYIPNKYLNDFIKAKSIDKLITYKVVLSPNELEL